MPFKSQAQIEKFRSLVAQGKLSQAVFDEWMKATPDVAALPDRVPKAAASARNPLAPIAPKLTPLGRQQTRIPVPAGMARRGLAKPMAPGMQLANKTEPGLATGVPRGLV